MNIQRDKFQSAINELKVLLEKDPTFMEQLKTDNALNPIRNEREFQELINK